MTDGPMQTQLIAELLLHLPRLARSNETVDGLTSAQWTALRFFGRANRMTRTPSAFAEFHGTTRGTASQTIKALVAKDYLTRTRSPADGRSVSFDLTPAGWACLRDDPLSVVMQAIDDLPAETQAELHSAVMALTQYVAQRCEVACFGTCPSCAHFEPPRHEETAMHCSFLETPLENEDLNKLCINFAPGGS